MPDRCSPQTRSYNMSMIKGKNTQPEIIVRKYLFAMGFRFRINDKRYPGRPDIVLPKYHVVIFVNGCFWHVHEGCKYFVWPKNNKGFWYNKLKSNVERDQRNYKLLVDEGWKVIRIWECQLRKEEAGLTLQKLLKQIM